jgi:hypothetical protein
MNRLSAALFCSIMRINGTFFIKHLVLESIHYFLPSCSSWPHICTVSRTRSQSKAAYNSFLPSIASGVYCIRLSVKTEFRIKKRYYVRREVSNWGPSATYATRENCPLCQGSFEECLILQCMLLYPWENSERLKWTEELPMGQWARHVGGRWKCHLRGSKMPVYSWSVLRLSENRLPGRTFARNKDWESCTVPSFIICTLRRILLKTKLRGFGPRANYTDRATAACWRS